MEKHDLTIEKLRVSIENKEILHDITFTVRPGKVHAIMGPNGSGKSTLSYALMGHPFYVTAAQSKVKIGNKNILQLPAHERAKSGLFLAFQSPIAVPGVSVTNLLRTAYQEIHGDSSKKKAKDVQNPLLARRWQVSGGLGLIEFMQKLKNDAHIIAIEDSFLSRGIHDGFSGGEKKKIEMLQALTLAPKYAIFDEIDTGLDVDALKLVAKGISILAKRGTGVIIITHYQRILKYIEPDVVHILVKGTMVETGSAALAKEIEDEGYQKYLS